MDTYLKACPGCPEVDILADFWRTTGIGRDFRGGTMGIPRGAIGAIFCLVGTEQVDIWEPGSKRVLIGANWIGTIVLKNKNTTKPLTDK